MKLQLNVLSFLSGEGMKQFLLSLLATTISIVLTFGTSAVLEKRQKEAAKKEMVMMIIYDFDMTIGQVQKADSLFQQAIEAQQAIASHLEYFDSLRHQFMPAIALTADEYSETTEKIFSSNIETFSTIGNVNFLHEVSSFYNLRRLRQEVVLDELKDEVFGMQAPQSLEGLFKIDFPLLYYTNRLYFDDMKQIRNRCMKMMKISEEELREFSNQREVVEDKSEESRTNRQELLQKMLEEERTIHQVREKLQ